MNERLIHLRIKIKSLAAEALIIREEAEKTKGMVKWGLNNHRTGIVRYHARHNLLAYGFLRDVPYKKMEQKCDFLPNFKMIEDLARKFYGDPHTASMNKDWNSWVTEARAYLKECGHRYGV